jgi:hypothetical protein
MDISLNMIDLEYLTNRSFKKKRKALVKNSNKTDINFYRKRVFQLTKDFLCGTYINAHLDNAFNNYVTACIEYFKFIDQSEIIQSDYLTMKVVENKSKKKCMPHISPDYLMMRTAQPINIKISDCIPIKYIKKKEKLFMPTNRCINLKDPKFRSKGLLKKNINNKYEKTKNEKKKTSE